MQNWHAMNYNLQERLDACVSGECNPGDFMQELSQLCVATPNAAWDVLSLVDQHYRRGKLSAELFRTVKLTIVPRILGVREGGDTAGGAAIDVVAQAIRQPVAASVDAASEVLALRAELFKARGTIQRYRRRMTVLAAFASLLLGVGVTADLQEPPRQAGTSSAAPSGAVAVATAVSAEPATISLSSDKYIVFPGRRSAQIQVRRTGGARGDVSFVYWTQSSGARRGRDYLGGGPKTVRLADGADRWDLSVPILANPARTHTELFYVAIGKPAGGASLGSIRRAAVFIMRAD